MTKKRHFRNAASALVLLGGFAVGAAAEVVRFEIRERSDLLGGRAFGLAGAYERIIGVVHFAFDPDNEANRIITDIGLAPRNAAGKVEMSADFQLLRPKVMEKGRGTLLHEVNNRGRKGMLSYFNMAAGSLAPTTEAHFGDGFLMRHGFTLLWLGWQWDVPDDDPLRMRMHPPIATHPDGSAIEGLVRADFVVRSAADHHSLADRNHRPYRVKDPQDSANRMTVRRRVEDEREVVPRDQWGFGRVENGAVVADDGSVYVEGGFQPHRIYEVVYRSRNPPLVGLGPAGIRDFVTRLRHDGAEELGIAKGDITSAISFGISQSGRFLRTFLYYGFNRDEQGRRPLDGVISDVAGGGRGSFNHRFAQASRDAHPYMNMFHPTDIFPFTDVEQTDPDTGLTAGLLTRQREEFYPRVFYTNSSYELLGPGRQPHPHHGRGRRGRPHSGPCAGVHVCRVPARASGVPSGSHHRPAAGQPEQLPLGPARSAAGHGPLGAGRRTAAAEPVPERGSGHRGGSRGPGLSRHSGSGRLGPGSLRLPRRLRPRLRGFRSRDPGTAGHRAPLPDPGLLGGRGRERGRRHPDAGGGRPPRHLHRLEPLQRGIRSPG